jgi:hypothetical protein
VRADVPVRGGHAVTWPTFLLWLVLAGMVLFVLVLIVLHVLNALGVST